MSDYFQIANPEDVMVRPLTKGMVANLPPVANPDGSFLKVRGFDVRGRGPTRSGGWYTAIRSATTGFSEVFPFELPAEDERVEDMVQVQFADGASAVLAVSSRFLYEVSKDTGYQVVYFLAAQDIDTYALSGTDGQITVADVDLVALGLVAGDYVWMSKGGDIEKVIIRDVDLVGTDTVITLVDTFAVITPEAADEIRFLKPFQASGEYFVDFVVAANRLYLVDTFSPFVFKYTYLGYLEVVQIVDSGGTRTMYGARTIAYFGSRLFFGAVREPTGSTGQFVYETRIRWTNVSSFSVSDTANYQDLAQSRTGLVKIGSVGAMLVAYTYDSVFPGRQTNLTSLPYAFMLAETGGVSIVGMKALCAVLGGQLFVGRDNIYVINSQGAVQRAGDTIARQSVLDAAELWRTMALADAENGRTIIGFSHAGESIDRLFFLNYETGAWSFVEDANFRFQTLALFQLYDEITYEEAEAETWTYEVSPYVNTAYYELANAAASAQLYGMLTNNHLTQFDPLADRHYRPSAVADEELVIPAMLETPDFDFGLANADKTVLALSLAIEEDQLLDPRQNRAVFLLEWSQDKGRTWRSLGYLVYRVNDEEDRLDFRATAPIVRFRLTLDNFGQATDNIVQPFAISEYGLRVRKRGPQNHPNMARPTV